MFKLLWGFRQVNKRTIISKISSPTEKQIESLILDWLNRQSGIFAFKVNTVGVFDSAKQIYRKTSRYVVPGTADIIACIDGHFVAIEVKRNEACAKRMQPNQKAFLQHVSQTGGHALVVWELEQVCGFVTLMRNTTENGA